MANLIFSLRVLETLISRNVVVSSPSSQLGLKDIASTLIYVLRKAATPSNADQRRGRRVEPPTPNLAVASITKIPSV